MQTALMNSRRRTARRPTTAAARPRGLSILGRCLQRRGPSSRKRLRRDRADRGRVDDVGPPNASQGLFLCDRAADHTAKGAVTKEGRQLRRPLPFKRRSRRRLPRAERASTRVASRTTADYVSWLTPSRAGPPRPHNTHAPAGLKTSTSIQALPPFQAPPPLCRSRPLRHRG